MLHLDVKRVQVQVVHSVAIPLRRIGHLREGVQTCIATFLGRGGGGYRLIRQRLRELDLCLQRMLALGSVATTPDIA